MITRTEDQISSAALTAAHIIATSFCPGPWNGEPLAEQIAHIIERELKSVPPQKVHTAEELEALKSPRGGWTKATLESLGVPWPPKHGWRKKLLGKDRESRLASEAESVAPTAPASLPARF